MKVTSDRVRVGIGPKGTSMLSSKDKLNLPSISDLSDDELRKLISGDREHRSLVRAAGRIKRVIKDEKAVKAHRPPPNLESLGLAPALIVKLRASGKSDAELIGMLKEGGII